MSHDFAVLTPELPGLTTGPRSARLSRSSRARTFPAARRIHDLAAFLADLEAEGPGDEDGGWVSVWPLGIGRGGIGVPTTYGDVDNNLVPCSGSRPVTDSSLPECRESGLARAREPVGVKAGDGNRLGGLTYQRLESLLSGLPSSDPWIVLESARQVYVQTLRREDGAPS